MSTAPLHPAPAAIGVLDAEGVAAMGQRDRMLLGMAEAISRNGYRGATITEVVRFARVSKRTFYEEFGDKESCFLELYGQMSQHLDAIIAGAMDPEGKDWRAQIASGARAYYTALSVLPLLTRALFIEIATLSDRATRVRREAFDQFADTIAAIVERARHANPEVPSRPLSRNMARVVIGGMTEVMIGAIERGEMGERIEELVDTCTDLIATLVTGQFPPAGPRPVS